MVNKSFLKRKQKQNQWLMVWLNPGFQAQKELLFWVMANMQTTCLAYRKQGLAGSPYLHVRMNAQLQEEDESVIWR